MRIERDNSGQSFFFYFISKNWQFNSKWTMIVYWNNNCNDIIKVSIITNTLILVQIEYIKNMALLLVVGCLRWLYCDFEAFEKSKQRNIRVSCTIKLWNLLGLKLFVISKKYVTYFEIKIAWYTCWSSG